MNSISRAVVLYSVGPEWQEDRPLLKQEFALEHVRYIQQLVSSGAARCAGPFWRLDELAEDLVGVIVLETSVEEAKRLAADDPAVRHARLVTRVLPFYPVS